MDPWLEQFEARRKEREAADRTFTLLGEELTVKPSVAPELALRLFGFKKKLLEYWTARLAAEENGTALPSGDDVSDELMLDLSESVIRGCLTFESLPAWERLRSDESEQPLSLPEIYLLADGVISKVTQLPTGGPSASSDGRTSTTKPSRVKSRSAAATRKS